MEISRKTATSAYAQSATGEFEGADDAKDIRRTDNLRKHIERKFSYRYFDEISLGIDFTARDLQKKCKEAGHPWEIAKSFDNSAVLGQFIKMKNIPNPDSIKFSLNINNKKVQQGDTAEMLFKIDHIIEYVSKFNTLKMGDLIFTGTPVGVGPVKVGDHLEGYIEGEKLLDFYVK